MFKIKTVSLLVIMLLALVCVTSIRAQRYRGRTVGVNRSRSWYRTPYRRSYGFYPYGFHYVSPAEGMAQVIRAQGNAAESYSKAAINNQEARSKYLDNKQKYFNMRQDMKRKGEAARKEYYAQKRAAREKRNAGKRIAPRPSRLSDSQLDPNTGKIYWPDELKNDHYKKERDIIDEAYILRNAYSHKTTDSQRRVEQATKDMLQTLKSRIRDIPSGDYISARRFLELLQNDVRA